MTEFRDLGEFDVASRKKAQRRIRWQVLINLMPEFRRKEVTLGTKK